jgi:hypothetical protein
MECDKCFASLKSDSVQTCADCLQAVFCNALCAQGHACIGGGITKNLSEVNPFWLTPSIGGGGLLSYYKKKGDDPTMSDVIDRDLLDVIMRYMDKDDAEALSRASRAALERFQQARFAEKVFELDQEIPEKFKLFAQQIHGSFSDWLKMRDQFPNVTYLKLEVGDDYSDFFSFSWLPPTVETLQLIFSNTRGVTPPFTFPQQIKRLTLNYVPTDLFTSFTFSGEHLSIWNRSDGSVYSVMGTQYLKSLRLDKCSNVTFPNSFVHLDELMVFDMQFPENIPHTYTF